MMEHLKITFAETIIEMMKLKKENGPKACQEIKNMKALLMTEMFWHKEPTAIDMYALKKHSENDKKIKITTM